MAILDPGWSYLKASRSTVSRINPPTTATIKNPGSVSICFPPDWVVYVSEVNLE